MAEKATPLPDAERFVLEDEAGDQTWVVLAIHEVKGVEYALLVPEAELADSRDDMEVAVFRYVRGGDGHKSLEAVEDEAKYEAIYEEFAQLLGLESSDEN
jgi:uncharacterized protein YrzB (UPF0473 family)